MNNNNAFMGFLAVSIVVVAVVAVVYLVMNDSNRPDTEPVALPMIEESNSTTEFNMPAPAEPAQGGEQTGLMPETVPEPAN